MHQERYGQLSGSQAGAQYDEITNGRYLRLAQENDTHFARLNKVEWRRLHLEAIEKATLAGRLRNDDKFQEALLIDAAGSFTIGSW